MVKALVIFFGGFFVFIAGGLLIEVINRKQNKQKMQRLAGKLGFNFCGLPPCEVLETLKGSDLFHWGGNLRSLNWIAGDYRGGGRALALDHRDDGAFGAFPGI